MRRCEILCCLSINVLDSGWRIERIAQAPYLVATFGSPEVNWLSSRLRDVTTLFVGSARCGDARPESRTDRR